MLETENIGGEWNCERKRKLKKDNIIVESSNGSFLGNIFSVIEGANESYSNRGYRKEYNFHYLTFMFRILEMLSHSIPDRQQENMQFCAC